MNSTLAALPAFMSACRSSVSSADRIELSS
jgi:hypothetical protein